MTYELRLASPSVTSGALEACGTTRVPPANRACLRRESHTPRCVGEVHANSRRCPAFGRRNVSDSFFISSGLSLDRSPLFPTSRSRQTPRAVSRRATDPLPLVFVAACRRRSIARRTERLWPMARRFFRLRYFGAGHSRALHKQPSGIRIKLDVKHVQLTDDRQRQ